ncbi:hypothetical protein E4K67_22220 [Desulfosporosinus fructosivorans]|uniref:Uncharacterized protein n=1 Tax=Desulfosporosinus fructosivorans TaxID=2018669 RepID=A0A4Z0QZY4_9FIRM|nr:hypothetical protein [Desulfosporosinus fructosivorans]TGE35839.1 hypothetical protein E4K67_22220 [Desulfosporosinus fructosivorans]
MEAKEKQIHSNGLLDKIIENYLIEERVLNTPHQGARESKMEEKLISLSKIIRDKLGSEQNLFMQYEELSTIDENASLRDVYRKGFIDGVALLREICFKA